MLHKDLKEKIGCHKGIQALRKRTIGNLDVEAELKLNSIKK